MEIRTLITFQKIYELRSFSKAAAYLGYSQSAVTMQIKQLESELNVKLFDRIGKMVSITSEGERFLPYASNIIISSQNAIADLSSGSSPKGELRIGVLESICMAYIPEILSTYHSIYPEVSTIIRTATFDELSVMLNTNQIDLLWTFDNPIVHPEWIKAFSYENSISVICSPHHSLAQISELSIKDIMNETFILTEKTCSYRKIFEDHSVSLGHPLNIFLEIGNTEVIKRFVEANLGIAILPAFTLEEELLSGRVVSLHLTDYSLVMQGQLFYHKSKWVSPSMQSFIYHVSSSSFD